MELCKKIPYSSIRVLGIYQTCNKQYFITNSFQIFIELSVRLSSRNWTFKKNILFSILDVNMQSNQFVKKPLQFLYSCRHSCILRVTWQAWCNSSQKPRSSTPSLAALTQPFLPSDMRGWSGQKTWFLTYQKKKKSHGVWSKGSGANAPEMCVGKALYVVPHAESLIPDSVTYHMN